MTTQLKAISSLLAVALCAMSLRAQTKPAKVTKPIEVKVVVLAMFEQGEDTGDQPGEYQYWVERDHLDREYPMPAAFHSARMNDAGELAIVTGAGTAHAASTVMALGLDPRFDLRHAYWLVAGIAGGCPDRISLGSAAWARWVLDADLAYEIDSREIPPDWQTGFLPLGKAKPYEQPMQARPGQIYQLNEGLVQWAFNTSRATSLEDSDKLRQIRAEFDGAAAQKPPFVMIGDEISSSTYWHGKLLDAWATDWMRYFSGGRGEFATTAMEDTGSLQSLVFLANAGRVDINRVMVLRAVSNYDRQPRELTAAQSLARQRIGAYAAYLPSLEAAYRVGHSVVNEILSHWTKYENAIPTAGPDDQSK